VELADKGYAVLQSASSFRQEKGMFWAGVLLGLLIGTNIGVILACMLGAVKQREIIHYEVVSESPMDYADTDDAEENYLSHATQPEPITYLDQYPHA
jgi:hypothetical protein